MLLSITNVFPSAHVVYQLSLRHPGDASSSAVLVAKTVFVEDLAYGADRAFGDAMASHGKCGIPW